MSWLPLTPRERKLTYGAEAAHQVGLEIGALNNPIIPPSNGNMTFVDYTDTNGLRVQHRATPERASGIVNVNFVWSGSGSLAHIVGKQNVFDFVIASHVIEHVPNTLGWFRGIGEVMRPGAVFNLAIPDKRYTFDINCPMSTVGELIEAYFLEYSFPSIRQMFDHTWNIAAIAPGEIWQKPINVNELKKYNGDIALQLAFDQAKLIRDAGAYFDSHCWIYTPESFLELVEAAIMLELFDFLPSNIEPTEIGEFEFFFSVKKPDESKPRKILKAQQLEALNRLKQKVLSVEISRGMR